MEHRGETLAPQGTGCRVAVGWEQVSLEKDVGIRHVWTPRNQDSSTLMCRTVLVGLSCF